jgi:hypothetical protein
VAQQLPSPSKLLPKHCLMDAYIDSIARGETEIDATSERQLSVCEYIRERDGETRHIFQLFCECNQVDETIESLMTEGKLPNRNRIQLIESDIADRIRIPWFGGAIKINPWFFLMPVLLTIEYYVAFLLNHPITTSIFFNLGFCYYSIKLMKTAETARSHMHLQFTGWSIFQVGHQMYQLDQFFIALPLLSITTFTFIYLRMSDPGVLSFMEPPKDYNKASLARYYVEHAAHRAKYCQINSIGGISRYDHFCIWIGQPIGKLNHKWFLLFCAGICMGGGFFWYYGDGGDSVYNDIVTTRCLMGCILTFGLLIRQSWLITIGLTSYENLHLIELKKAGWKQLNQSPIDNWKEVLFGGINITKVHE